MSKAKITWLGHASIRVEKDRKVFLLDPWIRENPACPIKIQQIKRVSAICVTHGHIDHIGDSIEIAKRTGSPLICSPEIGRYAERHGLKYDEESVPLGIGGSWETEAFRVTMVNAAHTSEIMGEEWKKDGALTPGSGAVGYVLDLKGGPSIYFGGDTGVFGDMAIIRDLYRPDVAILPVGGKYTMGPREAAYAAFLIHPKYFLPIHYDTFPNQRLNQDRIKEEFKVRAPYVIFHQWKPGDVFEYR